MAGGGAFSIDWALIQPSITDKTRVCSYDRAGLSWSDSGPADETVEQTIADLHTLLRAAGEKGQYLLVGASIGGIYIRAYQRAFPDEVAGLIFTNSSNRVGMSAKDKAGLVWDLTEEDLRSAFPLPPSVKGAAPTRVGELFDRLPPALQAVRLWLNVRLWEKWEPAKAGPDSMLSWRKEFLREFEETEGGKEYSLGRLPVIVVSSGLIASESERQSRNGAAARLDFPSSNTVHMTASRVSRAAVVNVRSCNQLPMPYASLDACGSGHAVPASRLIDPPGENQTVGAQEIYYGYLNVVPAVV
jgi:pimeloyl-ACP methyl ester carboxylesterase